MVLTCAEWRGEMDNQATTRVSYCPSTASFSVRPYCMNAWQNRCQEYHNCFPFGELEETTRTSSNYMDDEDYPARPEIKQSVPGRGTECGSESSTLEIDVCVWRYAPLVMHATQEEVDSMWTQSDSFITIDSQLCELSCEWTGDKQHDRIILQLCRENKKAYKSHVLYNQNRRICIQHNSWRITSRMAAVTVWMQENKAEMCIKLIRYHNITTITTLTITQQWSVYSGNDRQILDT